MCYMKKKWKYVRVIFLKYNSACEKQIILLMISSEEKASWYYLAVKKLCALLKGITSKHDDGFYYLNCFILLEQKTSLNIMKKYVKVKIFVECHHKRIIYYNLINV